MDKHADLDADAIAKFYAELDGYEICDPDEYDYILVNSDERSVVYIYTDNTADPNRHD